MGSTLSGGAPGASPRFFALAHADPGTDSQPGIPLQRLQIIKGWVNSSGERQLEVHGIAGGDNEATVDESTCEVQAAGSMSLCAVWEDSSYDPKQEAFYYLRAVEDPVCRWSTRQCLSLPEGSRPEGCSDETVPKTIQERGWTSAIWIEAE